MENRIAELEAAKRIAATSSSTDPTLLQSQTPMAQKVRSQPGEDVKKPEGPLQRAYSDSGRFSGRNDAGPYSQ